MTGVAWVAPAELLYHLDFPHFADAAVRVFMAVTAP